MALWGGYSPLPAAAASGGPTTLEGSGAATLPLPTATGVGRRVFSGSGTATLPLLTSTGAGKKARASSGAASLPLATASGAGSVSSVATWSGSGSPSLPLLTATGSGSFAEDISSGSGSASLAPLTASGSGIKASKGSGSPSLPIVTASGAGTQARKGSGTPSLGLLTATGSGSVGSVVVWTGEGAVTLPVLLGDGSGPANEIQPSGGWGAYNDAQIERNRRKWKKRQQELEEEADRLEALLIAEQALPPNEELEVRITVREYAPYVTAKRTQRAVDYALRARTALAYQLAAREIAREMEDEEHAVLLTLAML